MIMWQVWAEADMTEGRIGLRPTSEIFATKQEAWDAVNDRGGVMGRRPGVNCYPMDKLKAAGVTGWQGYEKVVGFAGDYDVRPVEVPDTEELAEVAELAELDDPTVVEDLRELLVELEETG